MGVSEISDLKKYKSWNYLNTQIVQKNIYFLNENFNL